MPTVGGCGRGKSSNPTTGFEIIFVKTNKNYIDFAFFPMIYVSAPVEKSFISQIKF